jgi:acyl-CoA hydrolase
MTIAVEMIRENLLSGQRQAVVRGSFEMVAVDERGRPIPILRNAVIASPQHQLT